MKSFAAILRKRRKELRVDQEEVVRRIGLALSQITGDKDASLSLSMYQKYEQGKNEPTWTRAQAILEALDLNMSVSSRDVESGDTSNQPLPNGVRANVYVGDKCILSGVLAPTETPLEIMARVQVGQPEGEVVRD